MATHLKRIRWGHLGAPSVAIDLALRVLQDIGTDGIDVGDFAPAAGSRSRVGGDLVLQQE